MKKSLKRVVGEEGIWVELKEMVHFLGGIWLNMWIKLVNYHYNLYVWLIS